MVIIAKKAATMTSKEISYIDARQRAEQCLRRELSEIGILPTIPMLEEKYAENSVCWIFFRSRTIHIPEKYAFKFVACFAYAISKWGGLLMVADNFDNEEELKIQMDRFETIHPSVSPRRFSQIWKVPNPFQDESK